MSVLDDGTEWIKAEIKVPKGTHLAPSRETPGLNRALLFAADQKGTVGPPEVRIPAPNAKAPSVPTLPTASLDPKTAALAIAAFAVGVITTVVIVKNRHRIKAWWEDKALPVLTSGMMWLLDIDPKDLESATQEVGPISTGEFSNEVAAVVEDLREDMSNEEAQRRILLVFMAASIISENMRKLKNARIADEDLAALQTAMSQLTSSEVIERVNEVLSAEDTVLDDETQALFVKVFGGGSVIDGVFRPLTLDGVQEALKLPDGDDPDDETAKV